ncbi:replication protein A2 [Aureococcus anophagefferens]|uniref:Replication protein A2 n=1 Tax=Aureococcus anophagefferens TaxID=44056 RepID=A0ABR1FYF3_AURAN
MLALRALVLRGRAKASLPKSLAIRKLVMSGDLSGRAKASLSTNLFFARLFSGTTAEVVNQIKVFNFYTTEGTGDEGCNVNFVARSLAMDLDQVKQIVEFFCFTGYLYPVGICDWTAPIDDDHHKSVAVVPLPDPPAAAPSLLPDPVFFLVLTFWLGAY